MHPKMTGWDKFIMGAIIVVMAPFVYTYTFVTEMFLPRRDNHD